MDIAVSLGPGQVVEAVLGNHRIRTDQPDSRGGEDSAPAPSDLFFASIAACAGYYVLNFCHSRGIPTDGIEVNMSTTEDPESHLVAEVSLEITLPPVFPAKYEKAVVRAVNSCSVKRHIESDMAFNAFTTRAVT